VAFLKFAGYDGIVVHGASTRWRYLHIDDDKAELRDASHLLSRDS
jgi:aldehyde:ferredoxin oxidoreductase